MSELTAQQARFLTDNCNKNNIEREKQDIYDKIKQASLSGLGYIEVDTLSPEFIQELKQKGYRINSSKIIYSISW